MATFDKKDIDLKYMTFLMVIILAFLHPFYNAFVGYFLFDLAGGIRKLPSGAQEMGGINWAFNTLFYVPGSYFMTQNNIGPCMWKSGWAYDVIFFVIGSFLTAYPTTLIIIGYLTKEKDKFGTFYWRLIVAVMGWIFIPVPVEMTLVYQFTVLC